MGLAMDLGQHFMLKVHVLDVRDTGGVHGGV